MTLEQQIASLNDEVGNLVKQANSLTTKVEDKLEEYQDWTKKIYQPNPVILQVGIDKKFQHPIEASNHINSHNLAGDVSWKIEIDPGTYDFPYQGIEGVKFSYGKNVEITGISGNAADVIFRYLGNRHTYMIIAENNSYIDVSNISFKGTNLITNLLISQIRNRTLRETMAGAGLAQGVLCRYSSSANIKNCEFNNLWHAIHCHDNCKIRIDNINGTQLFCGAYCRTNSGIEIRRAFLRGIGGSLRGESAPWTALGAFHGSYIFAYGVECRDFHMGLYSHWNSDFHLHQAYDYDSDGITKINIKNSHIENCYHAIHCWYSSGGNITNFLAKRIESHAILSGQSSNIHATENVTVDGANIGFYANHSSALVCNHSTARNCRDRGYYSGHKSEIHASDTRRRASGNRSNHSPGGSHALGNHDALMYIS